MYKQVLTPDKNNHSIEMPEQFFGKKVEVIVVELNDITKNEKPVPPPGKEVSVNDLFSNFGAAPDFPSLEEIRTKAWPSKW
jgi:hypothetical protein